MARRQGPGDWLAPAAATTTYVLVELLRVWLPSVTFIFGRAGSTPATTMGLFAATWFVVPLLAVVGLRRLPLNIAFGSAAATAALARLLLQATGGGDAQLWLSTAGLLAGLLALTCLAGGAASGHVARVGVVAGLLGQTVVHVALGTYDLAWRDGVVSSAGVLALTVTTGWLAVLAARARGWAPGSTSGSRGPAWPWLLVGPAVALVGILSGAPARFEISSGASPAVTGALLASAHLLALLVALLGTLCRPMVTGTLGAVLVLGGTLGTLQPTGLVTALAQLLLPLGVGALVGATSGARTASTVRRRAAAMAGSWLLFLVIGFGYYAAHDIALGISNRALPIGAACLLAALGLSAAVGPIPARPHQGLRATGAGTAAILVLTATVGGLGARHNLDGDVDSAAPESGRVTAVLANLQMGYDVSGRYAVAEQARTLAELAPDLLVLNEVDRGWLLTGGHDNLGLLTRALGLPNQVFSPAADEVWGNALLTRLPFLQLHTGRLPREEAAMARSLVTAVVELEDGRELGVIGTHLHHLGDEPAVRHRQAKALAGEVARLLDRDMAVLVLGDLNAEPGAEELAPLEELLTHAVPRGRATYPAWEPLRQIDHVLVSEGLEVVEARVVPHETSDHLFVSVEVQLR